MSSLPTVVIGAGIVGLATACELQRRQPRSQVIVIDKEDGFARHQTGRNSGVLHSGIYYRPGSLKADLCRTGRVALLEYARSRGITHDVCGKLLVATDDAEVLRLQALAARGQEHGLTVRAVDRAEALEIEPHVNALAALHVAETGIIDFVAVCRALVDDLTETGGELWLGERVVAIERRADRLCLETSERTIEAALVVNCGGLHSDRISRMMGGQSSSRIMPFRGEYFELRPEACHLVKNLVYPVPDPELPFLGVHLTRMIGGGVHAGPNAVLALSREGYRWRTIRVRDVADMAVFPGAWRVARDHWRVGIDEVRRSLSRRRFVESLQRLVPELTEQDLQPSPAGVRAQAVGRDGSLLDDFEIVAGDRTVSVLNAPSPAATSALAIGRHIASLVPEL